MKKLRGIVRSMLLSLLAVTAQPDGTPFGFAPLLAAVESGTRTFTPLRGIGHFHPILIHFPIALACSAAALTLLRMVRRLPGLGSAAAWLLVWSAVTAVGAAGTGWIFAIYEAGTVPGTLLETHRWWGTSAAILLVIVAIMAWRTVPRGPNTLAHFDSAPPSAGALPNAVKVGALLSAGVIGVAGHLGGELRYGEGFIGKGFFLIQRSAAQQAATDHAAQEAAKSNPALHYYLTEVRPIFAAHCYECHGELRQRGSFQLDPIWEAFSGDSADWNIQPNHADDSEVIRRVTLPIYDADAMPPEGARLTEAEVAILKRWINEGAVHPTATGAASQPR